MVCRAPDWCSCRWKCLSESAVSVKASTSHISTKVDLIFFCGFDFSTRAEKRHRATLCLFAELFRCNSGGKYASLELLDWSTLSPVMQFCPNVKLYVLHLSQFCGKKRSLNYTASLVGDGFSLTVDWRVPSPSVHWCQSACAWRQLAKQSFANLQSLSPLAAIFVVLGFCLICSVEWFSCFLIASLCLPWWNIVWWR